MKKGIRIILLICLSFTACKKNINEITAKEYYKVLDITTNKKDSTITKIKIVKLNINPNIETSYTGYFWVSKDTLYFSDTHFGYVYSFDDNGEVTNQYLGKGKGPNEILGIESSIPTKNGYSIFYGGNNALYSFDKTWKNKKGGRINWGFKRTMEEVIENPEPSLPESYEFDSGYENIIKNWDDNHVSISITASHPKFNGYFNTSLYYNYSRVLALVNINTGKIDKFIGRRSPFYLSKKNLPIFDHFNYESINKEVYVNFWADKYIYIINKKTTLAVAKFGVEGKNMNVDYATTNSYKEAISKHYQYRKKYGYYTSLKFLSKKKLLFRTYKKGNNSIDEGLQIYNNYTLIGDVDVPLGFEIIGVIRNTIIGTISNSHDEFQVFKVSLSYEK